MRCLVLVSTVVAFARIAAAEPPGETQREVAVILSQDPAVTTDRGRLELDATTIAEHPLGASSSTGFADASIGASIELMRESTIGDLRSYASTGGSAALRGGSDGVGATIQQHAESQPYVGPMFPIEVSERAAWDVAPSLTDRRDRWRRRYLGAGFGFGIVGLTGMGEHWGAELVRLETTFDWERQHDGDAIAHRFVQTADLGWLAILKRHDNRLVTRWEPLAIEARGISSGQSGAIVTGWLLRVRDEPFAGGKLDVMYGPSGPGEMGVSIDQTRVSYITSTDLPQINIMAWRAQWSGSMAGLHTDLRAEHSMYLGMDSTLVVEDRGSIAARIPFDHTQLSFGGFAARSDVWTSQTTTAKYVTGGASLGLDFDLPDQWKLTNQAEVARTFYASLEGDRVPQPDAALRIDVGLHKQLRNWVPH
jgi:hypothetical protein